MYVYTYSWSASLITFTSNEYVFLSILNEGNAHTELWDNALQLCTKDDVVLILAGYFYNAVRHTSAYADCKVSIAKRAWATIYLKACYKNFPRKRIEEATPGRGLK